jgi:pimeloyl-ACP methyl ester carboxylesterase
MRIPVILAVVLCTLTAAITAPVAPYENPLPAEPPYYRVRYEAPSEPQAGTLIYAVSYTVWIPPGVKTLRGLIVHQHGCGEGSCKSGQTGAYDLHWQALAKKHDCALMGPSYEQPDKADCQKWCDPRQGSDAAFQQSLADLGKMSGHPELTSVPWALWGHSGGGHWAGGMALLHPDRVAAAWLRSGVPPVKVIEGKPAPYPISDAATTVPLMCNLGTKEGVTEKEGRFAGVWGGVETFFSVMRAQGSLVGVAVDPFSSHDCGNQRYLAIPWLDTCLTARLSEKPGGPLKVMPKGAGWLAPLDVASANPVAPAPEKTFTGPLETSVWLPGEAIAKAWSQYVKDTAIPDTTAPPAPTKLIVKGNELTWECEADLESGLAAFVIERDGVVLAKLPEAGTNPFGRPVFQNLSYSDTPTQPLVEMRYTDKTAEAGKTYQYRIIAVNTVGLESK